MSDSNSDGSILFLVNNSANVNSSTSFAVILRMFSSFSGSCCSSLTSSSPFGCSSLTSSSFFSSSSLSSDDDLLFSSFSGSCCSSLFSSSPFGCSSLTSSFFFSSSSLSFCCCFNCFGLGFLFFNLDTVNKVSPVMSATTPTGTPIPRRYLANFSLKDKLFLLVVFITLLFCGILF